MMQFLKDTAATTAEFADHAVTAATHVHRTVDSIQDLNYHVKRGPIGKTRASRFGHGLAATVKVAETVVAIAGAVGFGFNVARRIRQR